DYSWSFEDEARTAISLEVVANTGRLDDAAFRSQLAIEDCEPAVGSIGSCPVPDTVLGIEHEGRIIRHETTGLGFLDLPGSILVVSLGDLPFAQPADPQQAGCFLFSAFFILPDHEQRSSF